MTALETAPRGAEIDLALPACARGIGNVINSPDSEGLIAGVKIAPLTLWPDDRGWFLELIRLGRGLAAGIAPAQVSAAVSYPGTIKAFHYHLKQSDLWCPVQGMLQIALVDLRKGSPTLGARNTIYTGALRPWSVLVPPGVGHGYKVIGTGPATLVYVTDQVYDPSDEGRIAYNDSRINYDWELQHK
ncbi:MAG: dTDP-4-dehydrorhamnose 3,5-epimerase family protein [bacterium]|jgi:dTDP-4-dehydrorhamnose 3,5-epimerase